MARSLKKKTVKRTKKFDPNKQLKNDLAKIIQNICFAWVPEIQGVRPYTLEGTPINIAPSIHNTIMANPQHWSCHCLVLCKPVHMDRYIKCVDITSIGPKEHRHIAADLNTEHQKLIKSVNDDHLMCAAWIIVPHYEKELMSFEVIDKIMTHLGAWEYKSGYEWRNS